MLETKEDKIKLAVGVGILVVAIVIIVMQFMPSGPAPGEVTNAPTVTTPEGETPAAEPAPRGGARLAPGASPSGS